MKHFATANWTCVAIATIGMCGCSSMGGKWWWQKSDDSIASRPPALPYAPDKPLASSTTPSFNSVSATPGGSLNSTASAPAGYPSTGYNAPASYTPPATAGTYNPPTANRANAWAPTNYTSASSAAYPTAGSYPAGGTPPNSASGTPPASAIGAQSGPYQGAYPAAVAAAPANPSAAPNYPAGNYPNPNTAAMPSSSGATPWVASAPASNDNLRTADARSGQPINDVSFAQRSWTPAPSAATPSGSNPSPPWGTNGVPQDTTGGEKAAAYNDSNNGVSNVNPAGGDVRSFGSPRKDPYFRPGSTKDFAPATGTAPPAAMLPSQPSARTESVTPANYNGSSTTSYASNETTERGYTSGAAASLAAPWNAAVAGNAFTQPSAMVETSSRYPAPSPFNVAPGSTDATANMQYGANTDVQSNGHVEVSVGGGLNAIRR